MPLFLPKWRQNFMNQFIAIIEWLLTWANYGHNLMDMVWAFLEWLVHADLAYTSPPLNESHKCDPRQPLGHLRRRNEQVSWFPSLEPSSPPACQFRNDWAEGYADLQHLFVDWLSTYYTCLFPSTSGLSWNQLLHTFLTSTLSAQ